MSFVDKSITCADCGQPFTFTAGEQEFHQSKGFTTQPRRCASCRAARKGGESPALQRRATFTVSCASCGKPADIPFEPREGRPVYCRDCFQPQPRGVSSAFARTSAYTPSRRGSGPATAPRGANRFDRGFGREQTRSPRGARARGW